MFVRLQIHTKPSQQVNPIVAQAEYNQIIDTYYLLMSACPVVRIVCWYVPSGDVGRQVWFGDIIIGCRRFQVVVYWLIFYYWLVGFVIS